MASLLLALLLLRPASADPAEAPTAIRAAAQAAGVAWPPPALNLLIDKSDHRLTVRSAEVDLIGFDVGLGDPTGDKVREGDRKTPTGRFTIVTRNEKSAFHLFLGISYPEAEDADRGLRDGLISASQASSIRAASAARRAPPWNTALGGAVGIHGGGAGADWTLGCIAVEDEEIELLWEIVRTGTPVFIQE